MTTSGHEYRRELEKQSRSEDREALATTVAAPGPVPGGDFFARIVESMPEGILVVGAHGTVLFAGGAFTRILGYEAVDAIGKAACEFIHPDDREGYLRATHDAVATPDRAARCAARMPRRDGSLPICEIQMRAADSGRHAILVTTFRDVSERAEFERKSIQNAQALRAIIDASLDVISINRLSDGSYIDNSASFSATGFERGEAVGRSSGAIGLWARREQLREFSRRLRERGQVRNMEVDFRLKDGTVVPNLISATVAEINGEKCIVSFARDISRIKKTENELRAAREAALAASRAKSEFLSSMSHEIRTPMTAILGMVELLEDTALDRQQQKYLSIMRNNGAVLLGLINDVLDLARIESGRLDLERTGFELESLIDKVVESFAARAHAKGLEMAARIAPGTPTRLLGDPLRLRQILMNLVGNAVKFTEAGKILIEVENDRESSQPGCLHFSVSDTGAGIPADKLDQIFEAFTQADNSTSRRHGGSGLGLAIVKRLVAMMDGRVWVKSEPGKGSTFHFTARFSAEAGEQAAKSSTSGASEAPADARTAAVGEIAPRSGSVAEANSSSSCEAESWRRPLKILLADDSADNRLLIRAFLKRTPHRLDEAEDGEAALRKFRAGRYDLILMDVQMPVLDGLETARRIRRLERETGAAHVPIIALTASVLSDDVYKCLEAGADAHLGKPISQKNLLAAIRKAASHDFPQAAEF